MANVFKSTSRNSAVAEPVDFLNFLFKASAQDRFADIHFHSLDDECKISLRVPGGALIEHKVITTAWAQVIDEQIRAKAQVSLTDKQTPLDGRFALDFDVIRVDVRVSITPGIGDCQLIVCRLLIQSNSNVKLADIEMPFTVRNVLRRIVEEPHGLVLVSGPTGSGKTTTLYALLNELNDNTRRIITVENPVEYRVPQFHQINVDGTHMTFAGALRTVLRQDPDIVMVGEIRDLETANIAIQAALTGHLVLSTIHANNAPMSITRLVDMGVDKASLNGALRAVVAQRLVRTIAPGAAVTLIKADENERTWLQLNGILRKDDSYPNVIDPVDGYKGVAPVMEVILVDGRVRKVMDKGEAEIYHEASRQVQFETLAQAAERLAFVGRTTLDQARHLTSSQDFQNIQNKRLGQVLIMQGVVTYDIIEGLLEKQSLLRLRGQNRKLGSLLVESNVCTAEQVHYAVGFTAEAKDVLLRIARTEEKKQKVYMLTARWGAGTSSLFEMAIADGFATEKEIYDAYNI